MGTITSLLNTINVNNNGSFTASVNATEQTGDSTQSFGAAVNVDLKIGTLSVAATGQIVDEWVYGASITGTEYTSSASGASGSTTTTSFEAMLLNLNVPIHIEGSSGSGTSSGDNTFESLANAAREALHDFEQQLASLMQKDISTNT